MNRKELYDDKSLDSLVHLLSTVSCFGTAILLRLCHLTICIAALTRYVTCVLVLLILCHEFIV